jgi:hypothetical protein
LVVGIWLQARRPWLLSGIPGSTEMLPQPECLAFKKNQMPNTFFFSALFAPFAVIALAELKKLYN